MFEADYCPDCGLLHPPHATLIGVEQPIYRCRECARLDKFAQRIIDKLIELSEKKEKRSV